MRELELALERVKRAHGQGRAHFPTRGESLETYMRRRALDRLDYNGSRSGYAAPATELARYLIAALDVIEELDGRG